MAVEYDISSDVAVIKETGSVSQCARVTQMYSGQITYDDEAGSKFATATINGKSQRVMLCIAVSGTVTYDDVPSLYSTVDGHRCLNIVTPTETGTPDDVPSLYETVVIDGQNVRAVRCIMINKTPVYDGVSSTCTFTGDDGKTHTAQLVNKVTGGSVEVIIKGTSPLNLPDAIANSLSYVKAFGGTEQRNLPDGYTQLEYIESTGTQYLDLGVKGNGNTKVSVEYRYHTATSASGSGRVFGSRTTSSSNAFAIGTSSGIVSATGNKAFWCYDAQSFFVIDDPTFPIGDWQTLVFSATEHTLNGVSYGDDYNVVEFKTPQSLKLFGFDNNGTMGCGLIDIARCKLWDNGVLIRDLVPCKNASNVIGMYDLVNDIFYTNQGTGDFVAGPNTVPTPDAPMDIVSNNGVLRIQGSATGTGTQAGTPTPTAPIYPVFYQKGNLVLRAVDGYADTYDATTQTITRNIGVHIYDGTESFSALSTPNTFRLSFTDRGKAGVNPLCSHYPAATITLTASNMPDKTIKGHATAANSFYLKDSRFDTADELKAWLADQYNAGTPVIIYYVLETPMTESFTPSVYTDGTVETINMHGKNLLNLSSFVRGKYINASGVEQNGGYGYSSIIKVVPGKKYTYNATYSSGTQTRIHGYQDGVWVLQIETGGGAFWPHTITIPANINGIRISCYPAPTNPQFELGETATAYEPYFDGGTATAEMLLKVGDYQDEQEILSGAVTRNVGVKVLDGTEFWIVLAGAANTYGTVSIPTLKGSVLCSHFKCFNGEAINTPNYNVCASATSTVVFRNDNTTTATQFKQWLADQYNAGTPVILVYPLATPTTESVAGQTLQVQEGDNTLEITQASLSGLELEAQYSAAVSLTIQEVEDANLDNNVEVTIS